MIYTKATNMSRINNMDSLDAELCYLKMKSKELERRLDHNATELRQNLPGMAMNSIVGAVVKQNMFSGFAGRVLHSAKIQDGIYNLLEKLTAKIGGLFSKKGEDEGGSAKESAT